VKPEDKPLLVNGLEHLSEQARYLRFFTMKQRLSDEELRYLTELDQDNHFALGAVRIGSDGQEEGLGVARFVKLASEPGVAEAAIVVVDECQRKGLGRLLLSRLLGAARERGVSTFKSEVLTENVAIRKLLHDLGTISEQDEGETLIVRLRLPDAHEEGNALYRLLRLAAEGLVRVAEVLRALSREDQSREDQR